MMKNTKTITTSAFLLILLLATFAAGSDDYPCDNTKYRRDIVTYKELDEQVSGYGDTRCFYYTGSQGGLRCKIKMRGTFYYPNSSAYDHPAGQPAPDFPVIVVNHGSEEEFEANVKFCEIATYFVPKGYIVFVPFRRGQGDPDAGEGNKSTGAYIEDILDDFSNGGNSYVHNTNCNNRSCYKAELLTSQADLELKHAIEWLQRRNDVNDDRIAIMGISYGGAVTVFGNRLSLGQKVAIAFSPGAQQWDPDVNCGPNQDNCGTDFQNAMISAARFSNHPAYYLQATWDYDTRATIDLAYAHAYGSNDPKHSRGWNAAIFPYKDPCVTPSGDSRPCTADDYQSIHAGFFGNAGKWGPTVHDFLKRYNVK